LADDNARSGLLRAAPFVPPAEDFPPDAPGGRRFVALALPPEAPAGLACAEDVLDRLPPPADDFVFDDV